MMDYNRVLFYLSIATLVALCWADTLVQLHVNRPYNDVSENFVSFAMRPDDLYDALDGPNRRAVTRMAAMLGEAYIKFIGDFYFATTAPTKLRNPTKIIWKGFNRWTRAVNWTMIIPVPYAPDDWDSMHTLTILNTSYMVGISDCIWQLGTDFASSPAKNYVQELRTLKLMADTYRPYVDDWRVMGADISAGSSPDETRRYIDMSKDMNAAFGWTQPNNVLPKSSLGSYIYDSDPALRVLQMERVPLWLTVPQENEGEDKRIIGDETIDALRWAQTLGDAASSGFDVVFKPMTLSDFEQPKFSFYVAALFKKVMGSRVFPARPLNLFAPTNKLYTHCANSVSGGLAFMVVNTEADANTISVRSLNNLASKEIWQYILTSEKGQVMLNNEKLSLNTTLRPKIQARDETNPRVQLITPSMSVGFWVLPNANLEHCQFTEMETDAEVAIDTSAEAKQKSRYSSADRLLQKLIEETSVARGTLQNALNRQRRFVLDSDTSPAESTIIGRLLQPLNEARSANRKRQAGRVRPGEAIAWLHQIYEQTRDVPRRRSARSANRFPGPFFYNKFGQKTTLAKKISEIRKAEKPTEPPVFDPSTFDEEEFFKNVVEVTEPPRSYSRLPHGDVHLKLIESLDGEPEEEESSSHQKENLRNQLRQHLKIVPRSEDAADRTKMRLPPTEFFEALPAPKLNPIGTNLGATLNTLRFQEPFSNKADQSKTPEAGKDKGNQFVNDFAEKQQELGKHFFSFEETDNGDAKKEKSNEPTEQPGDAKQKRMVMQEPLDESITSWWDIPALRRRRALPMRMDEYSIHSNMIDRVDELLPLGSVMPVYHASHEYRHSLPTIRPEEQQSELSIMKIPREKSDNDDSESLPDKIVTSVKSKVSKLMNVLTRHWNDWYNTISRHLDTAMEPETKSRRSDLNAIRE